MRNLDAAISVAADYAYHLYKEDGVPRERAIAAGTAAVLRGARATGARPKLPHRKRPSQDGGMGFTPEAMMGAGSLLSALGWIRNVVGI